MSQSPHYTVTVYLAAPGTPLKEGGTSEMGHMYYKVSNGDSERGYGFGPVSGGRGASHGEVTSGDVGNYLSPHYARTMEVTKDQYDKLNDYARDPERFGFSKEYDWKTNSCIDFTWGALNHAGLHRQTWMGADRGYEGELKVMENRQQIESITPPVPGSPLNTEIHNPLPPQTRWQQLFTENGEPQQSGATAVTAPSPADPSHPDHALYGQIRGHVVRLDADHGRQPDETTDRVTARLYAEAKAQDLSSVDHVLLSTASAGRQAGDNLFLVQGSPSDPAHQRASVPTVEAAQAPVAESFARAEQTEQARSQAQIAMQSQDQRQAQEQAAVVQRMG